MSSLNQVQIIGRLGQDPEIRYMPNGEAVANLSVATSESWTDKQTGERQERTEWHRITIYRKLAEVAGEYLRKGSQAFFQGRLQRRKWQDKEGKDRYTTEIIVDQLVMLGKRPEGGASEEGQPQQPRRQAVASGPQRRAAPAAAAPADGGGFDDDIPF